MANERIYKVTVNEAKGTCNTNLFKKMAEKGDLTSAKLQSLLGVEVKIAGYADCTIETNDNIFDIFYIDTDEYELISTGSSIFKESVKTYFGEAPTFKLVEIKTKRGKTYKAIPVLSIEDEQKVIYSKETTEENK